MDTHSYYLISFLMDLQMTIQDCGAREHAGQPSPGKTLGLLQCVFVVCIRIPHKAFCRIGSELRMES